MSGRAPQSHGSPRILVIAADQGLREFFRDGLPWAGCAIEFARDMTDARNSEFEPDVLLVDLPADDAAKLLDLLREYARTLGSSLIALTDDAKLIQREKAGGVQFLFRPCPPETLWDALAIAMADRDGG